MKSHQRLEGYLGKEQGAGGEKDSEWNSTIQFPGDGRGGGVTDQQPLPKEIKDQKDKTNKTVGRDRVPHRVHTGRGHLGSDQSEQTNLPECWEHPAGFRRATHGWCPLKRELTVMSIVRYF